MSDYLYIFVFELIMISMVNSVAEDVAYVPPQCGWECVVAVSLVGHVDCPVCALQRQCRPLKYGGLDFIALQWQHTQQHWSVGLARRVPPNPSTKPTIMRGGTEIPVVSLLEVCMCGQPSLLCS